MANLQLLMTGSRMIYISVQLNQHFSLTVSRERERPARLLHFFFFFHVWVSGFGFFEFAVATEPLQGRWWLQLSHVRRLRSLIQIKLRAQTVMKRSRLIPVLNSQHCSAFLLSGFHPVDSCEGRTTCDCCATPNRENNESTTKSVV